MTNTPEVREVIEAFRKRRRVGEIPPGEPELQRTLLRLIAEGQPVTAERFAEAAGVPLERAHRSFAHLRSCEGEFDDSGALVGATLTQIPTPHQLRVRERDLYAWCALDTLFLPALLGETADIESTCPVTATTVKLTVTPEGIRSANPAAAVVSIVVAATHRSTSDGAGRSSRASFCGQMHFFHDREAGEAWAANRSGVAIYSLEDASRLALEVYVESARRPKLAKPRRGTVS